MEALAALRKTVVRPGLIPQLTELSGLIEQEYPSSLPVVDSLSTATGLWGLSGFSVLEAALSFDVDPMDIIAALGKAQVIAGQEDQIIATASDLANELLLMPGRNHLLGGSGRIGRILADSLVAQPLADIVSIQIYVIPQSYRCTGSLFWLTAIRVKVSGYSAFSVVQLLESLS